VRIAGIVADVLGETIVIVVTVTRSFRLRKDIPLDEANTRPSLIHFLLRDGEFYFLFYIIEPYQTYIREYLFCASIAGYYII